MFLLKGTIEGTRSEEVEEWVGGEEMTAVRLGNFLSVSEWKERARWWLEKNLGS